MGGPQGRSGHVRKILRPQGFDPRTVHVHRLSVRIYFCCLATMNISQLVGIALNFCRRSFKFLGFVLYMWSSLLLQLFYISIYTGCLWKNRNILGTFSVDQNNEYPLRDIYPMIPCFYMWWSQMRKAASCVAVQNKNFSNACCERFAYILYESESDNYRPISYDHLDCCVKC